MASPAPQLAQTGFMDLISQSGPMAKLVLLMLLAASVFTWAIIAVKLKALRSASRENGAFLNMFWHGKSIEDIFAKSDKFAR